MAAGRLLVLDDDPTVAQIMMVVAQHAGFEARGVEAPQAFRDAVEAWQPTHVAVDLAMPLIGATEALGILAALGSRARVIIASGAGHAELEAALQTARALGLATAGVLPKPFSIAALRTLLAANPGADA